MYTSTIISTLFAAAVIAAPANTAVTPRAPAEAQVQAAQAQLDVLVANGCNILGCLNAVAPYAAVCAQALAKKGLDPVADVGCFTGVVSVMTDPPAACAGC